MQLVLQQFKHALQHCKTKHCVMILATCFATATTEDSRELIEHFNWPICPNCCETSCMHHCMGCCTGKSSKKSLQRCCNHFRNGYGNENLQDKSVAGYVILDNFSCKLCRNKIVRQVAQNVAEMRRS